MLHEAAGGPGPMCLRWRGALVTAKMRPFTFGTLMLLPFQPRGPQWPQKVMRLVPGTRPWPESRAAPDAIEKYSGARYRLQR